MRKYLEEFLILIKVPYVSRHNILHCFDCISDTKEKRDRIKEIISKYKDIDFDYKGLIKEFRDYALPRLRNECEVDAICMLLLSKQLKVLYKKHNISEKIFYDTMSDFRFKINECEMVEKLSGIFCYSFYEDFFKLKTFKLGRLEFELTTNKYDIPGYKKDSKILLIHIPKTGERLLPKEVDASIKLAKSFFKKYYKITEPVFVCSSWILFPENKKFLKKDSNIIQFANRFTILKTVYFDSYNELWRIFDRKFNGLRSLKDDSSLRVGYRELVKKNKPIGQSIGYFKG